MVTERGTLAHMTRRAALPDGLAPQFSVAAALAAEVSRSRLRANDLSTPFHGSRMTITVTTGQTGGDHAALLLRCAAYASVAPRDARFSHTTAALLRGVPLPATEASDGLLHVAVPLDGSLPRARGVRGHRTTSPDVHHLHGLPIVTPETMWLQLAAQLPIDELIVAGDYLVRRRRPLSSIDSLLSATELASGSRGSRPARAALQEIRAGTDSPMESRMRLIIVRAGLPEPVIGYTVIDPDGYFVGTPDLAYPAERIAIEYEGDHHRSNPRIFREDIERREGFERIGWRVLRVTHDHIRQPWRLESRVRELLAQRRLLR